ARDLRLLRPELEGVEVAQHVTDGQRGHVDDAPAANEHEARLGPQPGAVTDRAARLGNEVLDLLPQPVGPGLPLPALEQRDDAREGTPLRAPAPALHGDLLAAGSVEQPVARRLR